MGLFDGKLSKRTMGQLQRDAAREVAKRAATGRTCENCIYNNGRGGCSKWNKPLNNPSSNNCMFWEA